MERKIMFGVKTQIVFLAACFYFAATAGAGPYTEPGVNGYIGDDWRHANPLEDEDAILNPIFRGWATAVGSYEPAPDVWYDWSDPTMALGPVTGDNIDIVSLGDLSQSQINQGVPPGRITLVFGNPYDSNDPSHIRDVRGYDFVVFENAFLSTNTTGEGSIAGEMFAELGYVEVSSDGVNFARFPSISLTTGAVGTYGTIEISDVFNLAGKHPNAYGVCTGTPFDLSEIADDPNVVSGLVDINNISYVRIVDIPGSGNFHDDAVEYIDPVTRPDWDYYDTSHPVYDAWVTWGSGGFDLEAIGVLHSQQYCGDINLDGIVDYDDLLILASAWLKQFGQEGWVARCDLAEPKDYVINILDYAVFANQWLKMEQWRSR
jgi:hypothetical protein